MLMADVWNRGGFALLPSLAPLTQAREWNGPEDEHAYGGRVESGGRCAFCIVCYLDHAQAVARGGDRNLLWRPC